MNITVSILWRFAHRKFKKVEWVLSKVEIEMLHNTIFKFYCYTRSLMFSTSLLEWLFLQCNISDIRFMGRKCNFSTGGNFKIDKNTFEVTLPPPAVLGKAKTSYVYLYRGVTGMGSMSSAEPINF